MLPIIVLIGIVFLLLVAVVVILTPYYWCTVGSQTDSKFVCCLPAILIAVFLTIGIVLVVIGETDNNNARKLR